MTAHVLITGTIFRDPETRVAKTGKPFTFGTVKVKDGDATSWWKILAFGESARALSELRDGESLSAQGRLGVDTYQKDGQTRLAFTIVANCILPLRQPPKPRQPCAKRKEPDRRRPRETSPDLLDPHADSGVVDPRFDDALPF